MAILKLRDKNGNIIEIPAIRGKSAYEYAKEGGYTGTEADFIKDLVKDDVELTSGNITKALTYTPADKKVVEDHFGDKTKHISYGVCETESEVVDKVVTVDGDFELKEGAIVIVRFINSNGIAAPTLNVNGTGAKPMYRYGTTTLSTGTTTTGWTAGAIQMFIYNGTGWIRDYWNNTTYSNAALGHGYVTCSTAEATTAKTASLSSYALTTGGRVTVKFTNAVPANATLNVNSKGAKAIYYRGAKITNGIIKAGDIATFVYSTYYHLISIDRWQGDISQLQQTVEEQQTENNQQQMELDELDSLTLGKHTDGLIYLFKNGVPKGNGVEIKSEVVESGDVVGYIDENNNIVLVGALADETYTVKYEMEDGTVVDIGDLVLTRGPQLAEFTNLFNPSTATLNQRPNSSGGLTALDGHIVTAFIDVSSKVPLTNTSKIYIKGATFDYAVDGSKRAKIYTYKTKPSSGYSGEFSSFNKDSMTVVDEGNGVISVSGSMIGSSFASGVKYMVLSLNVKTTAVTADDIKDIIITIDEPIYK